MSLETSTYPNRKRRYVVIKGENVDRAALCRGAFHARLTLKPDSAAGEKLYLEVGGQS